MYNPRGWELLPFNNQKKISIMGLQRISIVFDKSRFRKLADAVQEAEGQIGHYGYNTVEILSESGKCLKIVRRREK